MLKINRKVKEIIILYIMLMILLYFFSRLELFGKYNIEIILLIVLFVIKDIQKCFIDFKNYTEKKISYILLFKNLTLSKLELFLVLNRNIIFPFLLIIYMLYLLIIQTKLWGIYKWELIEFINQNYLLGITIVSGILTVFKEDIDNKYFIKVKKIPIFSIILTIILSLLGTYIIFLQTAKLGYLVYPISIISGILIFLVGISILEDNENENNLFNNN